MIPGVIAGHVGDGRPGRSNSLCKSALDGLELFGADSAIVDLQSASFGARYAVGELREHLPVSLGPLLCVIDGRIDNLDELRQRLDLSGTASPATVLAHGWRRWRLETARRLIGEYAFAVHDAAERRLWLARDPSGYRPLFYRDADGETSFATMPSGLLAIRDGGPELARFARHVQEIPPLPSATFWSGIRQVPAGAILGLGDGRGEPLDILSAARIADHRGSWDELIAELRERLDRAVARNLAGTGPTVGAHLSSGLDSSAVAATAARRLPAGEALLALTAAPAEGARLLVPRGRFADESPLASETARGAGAEHIVIREATRLLPAIRGVAPYFQQPAPAQFSFPWWRAMSDVVRRRGGSIVLTGGQGNATLSHGGLGALARYLAEGRIGDWWREARLVSGREQVRVRGILFNSLHPLVPDFIGIPLLRAANGIPQSPPCHVRPEWRQAADGGGPHPSGYMESRLAMIRGFDAGTRKRGMLALTGVEERDPTADRELMEFALSLPPDAHLKDGRIKPLARDALADRVPAAILANRQRGASGADWYDRIDAADCRDAMEEIRASSSASDLLDLASLDRAIANWPEFDPARAGPLGAFGRSLARALSTGLFLAETDRYPLGRRERQ